MSEPVHQNTSGQEQASGCFVRLAWMLVANIVLAASAYSIAGNKETFLSLADAVFWAAVAAAIGLRYVDISRLNGETVAGQPATMAHWRRYAVLLCAAALVIWAAAHAIARISAS